MITLSIATWNVLHRIHAENWGEEPALRFPDERPRIAAITARVVARADTAICLQEVSGDQLASLRAALPSGWRTFDLSYPRVPAPRAGAPHRATLDDPTEHLVTLIGSGPGARLVEAGVFHDDPGKGFLAVELDGLGLVINTHVTFGDRRVGQLARVAAVARARAVVVGDFNADRSTVAAALGPDFVVGLPAEPALPTRPRTSGGKATTIDHVAVRGGAPTDVAVVDVEGVSDHNLVSATVG